MDAHSALASEARGPSWTRRAAALASRLAGAALDTLYPPTCLACRAATDGARRAVPALLERDAVHRAARFASASARRSSRTSARASSRLRRWPIRPSSPEPAPWRGSRTGRRARSCIGSNIPTAPNSPGRWRAGWRARARTCWLTPISSRRCRCILAAVAATVQPGGRARRGDLAPDRQAVRSWRASARQGDPEPGRPQPRAAGRERPGRVSGRRRRAGARAAISCSSTTC